MRKHREKCTAWDYYRVMMSLPQPSEILLKAQEEILKEREKEWRKKMYVADSTNFETIIRDTVW